MIKLVKLALVAAAPAVALAMYATPAASAGVVSHDAALCRYFPEFGSSLAHAERTRRQWSHHIPGTDAGLHRDAARLNAYLIAHPHARTTHGRYVAVYLACNPDA